MMDIQKVCIYELPLTRKCLDYAVGQRYHRSRDNSILVMMDMEPAVKNRKLTGDGELNELERRWALDALVSINGESKNGDKYKQFFDFLDRLEKELEIKEKGGDSGGVR